MEPELRQGDIIALKPVSTPIEYLPTNEIYAIVTEDYRTVKRIELSDREGFIRLLPSNPEYKAQEIPISMITRVYAVLGSIRKFF
jgi:signal peptidase I